MICYSQFTGDGDKYADAIAIAVDVISKRVSIYCMECFCMSLHHASYCNNSIKEIFYLFIHHVRDDIINAFSTHTFLWL